MKQKITLIVPGCCVPTKVRRTLKDPKPGDVEKTVTEVLSKFSQLKKSDVQKIVNLRKVEVNGFRYSWSVKDVA